MADPEFDYVILGAGTAGCLLANRLSADPARRVLLVEAGGPDDYAWIHIPVGYLRCMNNPRTDWLFRTEPEAALHGRELLYPRGRTLGGSSSINGMIYMRGQARDYDAWAQATGDAAWAWSNVLPDFRAHECSYRRDGGADDTHHGTGGEWRVSRQRLRWDILDAFAEAAEQAGFARIPDFNTGDNAGFSYFDVNQRAGLRVSSAKAFLKPAKSRPNLTVWTRALTERLHFDRDAHGTLRCAGATLVREGTRVRVRAARETLLCSGAIGSPQLLQLSGVGPGALLREHGIEVLLDAPGVGANLQDHLQIRPVFKVRGVRTLNERAASFGGRLAIALEYALRRTGPMSMAPSQLGGFVRSDAARVHANLQYHVQPLSLRAYDQPPDDFPAFTASVCNLNPESRGTVLIRSADVSDPPRIAPNYLATDEDRRIAAESLRITRRIVEQPALAKYFPEEHLPGAQFVSDQDLLREGAKIATTIFHPVGTARMGANDDPLAVLDSHLHVRGTSGLRVVDASVMPTITSGNTSSPTLMIAEKASRWILAGV